ncbi:hypothetical protein ACJ73_03367 [Blastomyces percursus]|uniref:Uncharacterized protein n=1 Tax=Blastomyces percursus TaxID=1658174 RepID=A0A1J9QYM1_9EURO|nr:hypothetical protein ACJ73_03367 [Blastomyces percursus]
MPLTNTVTKRKTEAEDTSPAKPPGKRRNGTRWHYYSYGYLSESITYLRQNNEDTAQQLYVMANEILTCDNINTNARNAILSAMEHRDARAKEEKVDADTTDDENKTGNTNETTVIKSIMTKLTRTPLTPRMPPASIPPTSPSKPRHPKKPYPPTTMPNAITRRPTATSSSNTKGGDNTSLHNEIMEIRSQVPEMIKILKQMVVLLEMITPWSKEQYDADLQASATEDRNAAR